MTRKTIVLAAAAVLAAAGLPAQTTATAPTPAQQKVVAAQTAIEKSPGRAQAHNDLALALARRARETSDPDYYRQAEAALAKAFALDADNYEARRVQAWVLLGKHEFAKALEATRALNRRAPDDLTVYGYLVDANAELGRYEEAERAAQWMLDLRPGNVPGLTRAAYLRELLGDVEGALELMTQAFHSTPSPETEDRAWILTQMGHLLLSTGKVSEAERTLERALALFPGYHYALAQLGRVRAAQGRRDEAADLLRKRYEAAPHPENLYDLAEALRRAGRAREAAAAFADFETKARAESEQADNANRELIAWLAGPGGKPAEAVRIAEREIAVRRDVHTLDAYAWALHAGGRDLEALKAAQEALAVGIRDASMLYHAGVIAAETGDRATAERYLKESLAVSPVSEVAADARAALSKLRP